MTTKRIIKKSAAPEKTHSAIGASSADRWFACPGSIRLSKGIKKETSIYAMEGTVAHELAEECLKTGRDPSEFLGNEVIKDLNGVPTTFTIDDEMTEGVQLYLNTIEEIYAGKDSMELLVEESFNLDFLYPGLWGTNDACITDYLEHLYVIDFKYGKGKTVDVQENKQLLYYGVGARRKFPGVDKITLVIVQPRAPHKDGRVRKWTTDAKFLDEWEKTLVTAAKETASPNAEIVAGGHCWFCPANNGTCPVTKLNANKNYLPASTVFSKIENSPVDKIVSLPEPSDLTPEELSVLLHNADAVDAFFRNLFRNAQERAMNGVRIPEYKLVRKKTNRKIKDEVENVKAVLLQYIPETEIYKAPALKGIGDLEAILKKSDKVKRGEAGKIIDTITNKPIGDLTLVPAEDGRDEVLPPSTVEGVFTKIETVSVVDLSNLMD